MMAALGKRPRTQRDPHPSKKKRIKRQLDYHSSDSDDDEQAADEAHVEQPRIMQQAEAETDENVPEQEDEATVSDDSGDSEASQSASDDDDDDTAASIDDNPNRVKVRKKRNDPAAFATSMSKILNTKLTVSKRADPVLSRSKDASAASRESQDARLEAKAKQQMREEKRARLETGRVRDVLGLHDPDVSTEGIMAREKRYRKLAQQGVIRLFNAVLAAQLKGQEASRAVKQDGVVGMAKREDKVNEMSKQGFLDLIAGGGKK